MSKGARKNYKYGSWKGPKVDIVLADFCSGFEPESLNLLDALDNWEEFFDCSLMINFQRGRDPKSNVIREMMGQGCFRIDLSKFDPKHRGLQMLWIDALELVSIAIKGEENVYNETHTQVSYIPYDNLDKSGRTAHAHLINGLNPKAYSYQSDSGIVFDSIIVTSRAHKYPTEYREALAQQSPGRLLYNLKTANQIRAALAIRTQRANGILEHQPWA